MWLGWGNSEVPRNMSQHFRVLVGLPVFAATHRIWRLFCMSAIRCSGMVAGSW